MTRSISLIVSLALVITAVAIPGASASSGTEDLPTFAPFNADLRSPDARDAGRPAQVVQARGTDVAAPDQQSPTKPASVPVSVPEADGFDWTDAGLGAAGFAALALTCGGVAAALRMRRGPVRAS